MKNLNYEYLLLKGINIKEKSIIVVSPPLLYQTRRRCCSEEVRLLHDPHELFLTDFTVTISIGLINHLLNLIVGHVFTKLLGDPLEVFERNFTSFVIVK